MDSSILDNSNNLIGSTLLEEDVDSCPIISNNNDVGPQETSPISIINGNNQSPSSTTPIIAEVDIPSPNSNTGDVQPVVDTTINPLVPPELPIAAPLVPPADSAAVPLTRRGARSKQPSVKLKDFITNTVLTSPINNSSLYPISNYVSSSRFTAAHRAFQAAITQATEPRSFAEAVRNQQWCQAMSDEIAAQELNGTWEITDLPPGKKTVGCKWVYKFKFKSDGALERYKARLVALGNKQIEGEDYGETFSPVAKMGTVRLFLRYAAGMNWVVHQMDVHNAFLHGDLEEEVYMRLPPGFQSIHGDKVCRLRKALYGLKQAPRCWFSKLSTALKKYGFQQSYADYSLFMLNRDTHCIRILIYVDDLVIAGSNEVEVQKFKDYLSEQFHMKDLGLLKYFLGIEVARNKDGFYLCQRKYALDLISDSGLLGARPSIVPIQQHHSLAMSTSTEYHDPKSYRRLIGKMIYLANTRPDLSYSVHILAQFMQQPKLEHWDAALKVVRYLKNSPGRGIFLSSSADFTITGWCDSDWASCPLSRRSLTGYVVQFGGSTVSWKTKKQPTVSTSSAEAEYRSMAMMTKELIWIKRLVKDLGYDHQNSMAIFSDSKSAIEIAKNPVFHERTKHIGVDCHFVRDAIEDGTIHTSYVNTKAQLADLLTKALGRHDLELHNDKLGVIDVHAPT